MHVRDAAARMINTVEKTTDALKAPYIGQFRKPR
jgi:hypothetical protein